MDASDRAHDGAGAARPFEAGDLESSWSRPRQLFDVVLSAPERLAANIEGGRSLAALACVLLFAASAFAIPYGFVIGFASWWRIAALYLGSTLICLPSLYVFASYLGVRARPAQVAVLALTIPAVAALFTFGFAPILGFLRATMDPGSHLVPWSALSLVLLALALFAGIAQLWRCLFASSAFAGRARFTCVLVVWQLVFLHVFLRMLDVLGLGG